MTSSTNPAPERRQTERRKGKLPQPQWYWMTRSLGTFMVLYGILVDHTPERGTLIITGAGLAGVDKVLPPRDGGGTPPTEPPTAAA